MTDIHKLIANGKVTLSTRAVDLCLAGHLVAELEILERQWRDAHEAAVDSLAGNPLEHELSEQIKALREQMKDSTVTFRVQAIPRRRIADVLASCPPREGNEDDAKYGFNVDAYDDEWIKASVVDPQLSDEEWAHLLGTWDDPGSGVLSGVQFRALLDAANGVNTRQVSAPFSRAASQTLPGSDES